MNRSKTISSLVLFVIITSCFTAVASAQKKGENLWRKLGKAEAATPGKYVFKVPAGGLNYSLKCNFGSARDIAKIAKVMLKTLPEGEEKSFLRKLTEVAAGEVAKGEQSKATLFLYDAGGKLVGKQGLGKSTFRRNIPFKGQGAYTAVVKISEGNSGYWHMVLEYGGN